MSGGSFGYLCFQRAEVPDGLVEMAEESRREGFVVGADALDRLLATYGRLNDEWRAAEDFMRAFEWWRSMDWPAGRVAQAEHRLREEMEG